MPLLKNARRERFAQAVASGKTADAAYVIAGYKQKRDSASRLRWTPEVAQRIDELLRRGAERAEVTAEKVIAELAKIAFANAGDYFSWGPGGVTVKPSDELTEEQRSVIAEVCETRTEAGGSIRVKLSDKQAALEKLGRHLGLFKDKVEHSGPNGGPIQTEAMSARDRILGKLARLSPGSGAGDGSSGSERR